MKLNDLTQVIELVIIKSVFKQDRCVEWRGDSRLLQGPFVLSFSVALFVVLVHFSRETEAEAKTQFT